MVSVKVMCSKLVEALSVSNYQKEMKLILFHKYKYFLVLYSFSVLCIKLPLYPSSLLGG